MPFPALLPLITTFGPQLLGAGLGAIGNGGGGSAPAVDIEASFWSNFPVEFRQYMVANYPELTKHVGNSGAQGEMVRSQIQEAYPNWSPAPIELFDGAEGVQPSKNKWMAWLPWVIGIPVGLWLLVKLFGAMFPKRYAGGGRYRRRFRYRRPYARRNSYRKF